MAQNILQKDINTAKIIEKAVPKIEDALEIKDNKKDFFSGKKAIIIVIVVVAAIGFALFQGALYFFPKEVAKIVGQGDLNAKFPLNTTDIKFLSEQDRTRFSENLTRADGEKNHGIRYKYYEENFIILLGFYNQTYSYDYRVQLIEFREFVRKAYPQEYEKNHKLYDFNCIDKLCSDTKVEADLGKIVESIRVNEKFSQSAKDGLIREIETSALIKEKNERAISLVNTLSGVYSQYSINKDESIRTIYLELRAHIGKTYPDVQIPKEISLE